MNDLWRYRVNDSTWTWISGPHPQFSRGVYGEKGIPSINNVPSARHQAAGGFDEYKQEIWIFGGFGKTGDDLVEGE